MQKPLLASFAVLLMSSSSVFSQAIPSSASSQMPFFAGETADCTPAVPTGPCSGESGQAAPGYYVGIFGGGGGSSNTHATQSGTALFPVGGPPDGLGPLSVNADGNMRSSGTYLGGFQIGHEWSGLPLGTGWALLPALEYEAYYLGDTQNGYLINPTPRLDEHDFLVSLPTDTGVFLANAVVSLNSPVRNIYPYIGAGVGSAVMSIHGANSAQLAPPEPGINHFNSDPNASSWAFATQGKAGVRFALSDHWNLFGEYRYLYIGSTEYVFGSTQYPTHIPTTPWNMHLGGISQNVAVLGLQYRF
ncbi:MAG TPA: outer membrane beta-barrel protein [Gemmataceae bacterium]|jgi:opacity protein-like surface antigen|nr:outer membrane beta-barrel protein [Gemmataceae bacterium]